VVPSLRPPLVLFDPAMIAHDPGRGHPERPDRLRVIEAILEAKARTKLGLEIDLQSPAPVTIESLVRVHSQQHIDAILELADTYDAVDPDTRVSPGSIRAAQLAAGAAIASVDALLQGTADTAFAMIRPPGHHADGGQAMGFCLLNNVAVAAAHARAAYGLERIMIVDWDVHHGNGTQAIFYEDPSVLFFSTHQYPFYPGTGSPREVGRGAGLGFTVNVPLAAGATDGDLRLAFEAVLEPIAEQFRPELVLVSAGFDAHRRDPLGGFDLSADGFASLCGIVQGIAQRHAKGRLALLLEGGYDLEGLSQSVLACLWVLGGRVPPMGPRQTTAIGESAVKASLGAQRQHWRL